MSLAQDEFNELMRNKERRTRHPGDDGNDDAHSFLNLSDDDENRTPTQSSAGLPRASLSSARSTIPTKRYGANTGPKGVISDAQNFRDSCRSQRTSMHGVSGQASSLSVHDKAPAQMFDEEDEDSLLDEEGDEGFMEKWRQTRLQEMRVGPQESTIHRNRTDRRVYGALTMVDPDGYLDAVENTPSTSVVVVYIYDDFSQVSDLFERCVRTLANKHQDARFVKLHYEDAQMEPAGVPAIIAYRGGDKFAGLVPLINELPDDAELNAVTLESVMKRHQILL